MTKQVKKIIILKKGYKWKKLRALRNNLTHDYPDDEHLIVDTLNDLYYEIETIEEIVKKN